MPARLIARVLYALNAAAFLAGGAAVLLLGTGLLPQRAHDLVLQFGGGSDVAMHLAQEASALLILAALVCLWCIRHYDRSLYFHWAFTLFWTLIALVHFFDYHGAFHADAGAFITAVPGAVYLVVGALRVTSKRTSPAKP